MFIQPTEDILATSAKKMEFCVTTVQHLIKEGNFATFSKTFKKVSQFDLPLFVSKFSLIFPFLETALEKS